MDLKSGCAFEAGLEPPTQERGCYETRCLKKFGKIKAFSTKTKTKEIFKGGSIKKITIIPPPTKIFNYYTRQKEKPIIITNKIPSPGIPYSKDFS